MLGRQNSVNLAVNTDNTAKTTMINAAREHTKRIRQQQTSPADIMKSKDEGRAELERKIRNREVPCPTCKSRKYKDKSDDGGVSFQSAKHIPAANAGIQVMQHEGEHVSRNATAPGTAVEGEMRTCSVQLLHDTCPTCGRSYVSGGLTFTHSQAAPDSHTELDELEAEQRRLETAGEEVDITA